MNKFLIFSHIEQIKYNEHLFIIIFNRMKDFKSSRIICI
jgi:hypothetical protein